ncbi:BolA family transcriptional regulator [Legionella sp. km772]|uniref:BolA family protein n=1 Tax=Legionella sp. km772 TaxID=2498111 RepID=UPI000F8F1D5D|nr:BolA family protein [Legionella sp. km772]RUR11140.1 BolA family transcriptional regulator [Legionella sp. km772]
MSRKERIQEHLLNEFNPLFLLVEDESSNHHVPENAQTHYKIIMASPKFNELSRVHRHRLVNKLLQEEFDTGMHALSMHLFTPTEWESQDKSGFKSPPCRDGYKNK